MLRTRAMRERDEMKMFIKHYRFVLLRVRMPDGLILQGEERRERERERGGGGGRESTKMNAEEPRGWLLVHPTLFIPKSCPSTIICGKYLLIWSVQPAPHLLQIEFPASLECPPS